MRRSLAIALVLPALAFASAGCGKEEAVITPAACLEGEATWLDALKEVGANGGRPIEKQVLLGGETPISDCIPADQTAARQQTVGRTAVAAASYLSRAVRNTGYANIDGEWVSAFDPAREAGYLVGALERGAERSQGIHATLVERVRSAATNGLDRMSENEQNEYDHGYEAGRESG